MLDCARIEERLSEYLDGLLGADERSLVEEHLAVCGRCEELHESMAGAVRWTQAARSYSPPEWLVAQILANTPQDEIDSLIVCSRVEEQLSHLVDGLLSPVDERALGRHLAGCDSCRRMHDSMTGIVRWGERFPSYDPPAWLAARILANTRPAGREMQPAYLKETWIQTLAGIGRWILEPRTAMAVFTTVLVLGWMSSIAGVSLDPAALSNPSAVYYSVEELADDVYDRSVRFYYGVPHRLVGEIQYRIEQMRESS